MNRFGSASRRSDSRAAEDEVWELMLNEHLLEEWDEAHRADLTGEWNRLEREVYGKFNDGLEAELSRDRTSPTSSPF